MCGVTTVLCVCSRPETPGRESSVWNASTVLDVSSSSGGGVSQQQLSGASPMSMSMSLSSGGGGAGEGGWNQHQHDSHANSWGAGGGDMDLGAWDEGGHGGGGGNDWQAAPSHSHSHSQASSHLASGSSYEGNGSSSSSSSSIISSGGGESSSSGGAAEQWDVDMIVIFRFGPDTGRYAIIVHRPERLPSGVWTVDLRMRESSSSGRRSDDNPMFAADCRDLRLGEPRKRDRVRVLYGAHQGVEGVVKAVLGGGEDVVLTELPSDLFNITQVAWMHTR